MLTPSMPGDEISKELLIKQIEAAFANVDRVDAVSLHQTSVIDDMGSEEEMRAAALQDKDQHWSEIPDRLLDQHDAALSFFDNKGWVYHLPAFLCWVLSSWDSELSSTSHDSAISTLRPPSRSSPAESYLFEWQRSRFDSLNDDQRTACARFLRYLGWQHDDDESRDYYQSYWHQFDH